MKVEITHDILAQKVFAKLDAERKELLEIKGLIENRCERDSLLNRKELQRIKPFLKKIELTEKQDKFIKRSRHTSRLNRATNFSIFIFPIILFLLYQSNQRADHREEQQKLLSDYIKAKFNDDQEEALTNLEEYLDHDLSKKETTTPFYLELAQLYKTKGQLAKADTALLNAIEKAPVDEKPYYTLQRVLFLLDDKGDKEQALKLLDSVESDTTNKQIRERVAEEFLQQGRYEDAKRQYDNILSNLPENTPGSTKIRILDQHVTACLNLDKDNAIEWAIDDYVEALRISAEAGNTLIPADSSFLNYANQGELTRLLKEKAGALTPNPDSVLIAGLNRLLFRLDPINSITVESIGEDSVLVYDADHRNHFPLSRGKIAYPGVQKLADHYQEADSWQRVLAAVSLANLDAVSTQNYNLAFGSFQWNIGVRGGGGELPALLYRIKQADADAYQRLFQRYGLDISEDTDATSGYLLLNDTIRDNAELKAVFQQPEWAFVFWKAAQDKVVLQAEIEQMESRLNKILNTRVAGSPISEIITSEYGIAALLDYSLGNPYSVDDRLTEAIEGAGEAVDQETVIMDEFIKAWEKSTGNSTGIEVRLQKLKDLNKAPGSF